MSRFELLLACIRSGQLSDEQLAAELKDPAFLRFYQTRTTEGQGCTNAGR